IIINSSKWREITIITSIVIIKRRSTRSRDVRRSRDRVVTIPFVTDAPSIVVDWPVDRLRSGGDLGPGRSRVNTALVVAVTSARLGVVPVADAQVQWIIAGVCGLTSSS